MHTYAIALIVLAALLSGTALVQAQAIPGDYNGDGIVDIRDYGVWRANFGATDCGNPADGDGNCIVDIRDYAIWRFHFGETRPTATPTFVGLPVATATATNIPTNTATPTRTSTPSPTPPCSNPGQCNHLTKTAEPTRTRTPCPMPNPHCR